jgi:hypothetical protein
MDPFKVKFFDMFNKTRNIKSRENPSLFNRGGQSDSHGAIVAAYRSFPNAPEIQWKLVILKTINILEHKTTELKSFELLQIIPKKMQFALFNPTNLSVQFC